VRWSPVTNPTAAQSSSQRATFLQASLVISGTGANQQGGLFGATGAFFQESNSTIAMAGGMVGYSKACATCVSIRTSSGVASSQIMTNSGLGNAIYGPNANYIVAVPDIVQGVPNSTDIRHTAAEGQFPFDTLGSQQTDNGKFFATVATQNAASSSQTQFVANGSQTTQVLSGYVGGGIENRASNGSITLSGFGGNIANNSLTGPAPTISIVTDATSNRVQATFGVTDATSTAAYALNFGAISGFGGGRSSFISDLVFGARDAISTQLLSNGNYASTSTVNGSTVFSNNLFFVTSNTVPIDLQSFAGPGVTACTCSFMQWGWWAGEVQNNSSGSSPRERFIGTWVAGTLPNASEIPMSGTATFNGHAIGSVSSNVGSYVAAGNYQQNWNFASASGTATISNFDRGGAPGAAGMTISGAIVAPGGVSNQVSFQSPSIGSFNGGGVAGAIAGSFYKNVRTNDPIAGVGGSFAASGTVNGGAYKVGGTFAACRAGTPC
jgi:hypothetical protein